MNRVLHTLCGLLVLSALTAISGCGSEQPDVANNVLANASSTEQIQVMSNADSGAALQAVLGASEIPYPVYPNGSKYRVGGENGLKIVVFQTDDAFDKVDEFYSQLTDNSGMARLMAMNDYVRYSQNTEDHDPWATYRPGIVIHNFNNDTERQAVGARLSAKTNIIMSF